MASTSPPLSQSTVLASSPLKSFTKLNASVFLYVPPDATPPSAYNNNPDLILLHGWMDATPQYISKYTARYQVLFPRSSIIAVTTSLKDCVFSSRASNLRRIDPELRYLDRLHSSSSSSSSKTSTTSDFQNDTTNRPPPPPPRILIHTFSNGGLYTTSLLLQAWHTRHPTAPLNIHALIMDSSPGRTRITRAIAAMLVGLPRNPFFVRLAAKLLLRIVYLLYALGYLLARKTDFIELARRDLLDARLVPLLVPSSETRRKGEERGKEGRARRLYVYSASDEMVADGDVEDHAAEARRVGWDVRLEKFVGSQHAAHVLVDPGRYWGAVQRTWEGGV